MKTILSSIGTFLIPLMVLLSIGCFAQSKSIYLPPPTNFQVEGYGGVAHLTWNKPVDSVSGNTPAGLMGYRLYLWDVFHNNIWDPDSLEYYDLYLEPEDYKYTLTAIYDLSYYGTPGDTAESDPAGPVFLYYACPMLLPFYEPWDQGIFSYQDWHFEPSQGNWVMSFDSGNPIPSAAFSSTPVQTNYSFLMRSITQCTFGVVCADYFMNIDLKLDDSMANGTEKMIIKYYVDSTWNDLDTFYNNGNISWTNEHYYLPGVEGKRFRIGFSAEGLDSRNINNWYIDNIEVYLICHPPRNLTGNFDNEGNVVLRWQLPECSDPYQDTIPGYFYNVYRLQHPWSSFQKIFSGRGNDTVFIDSTVVPGLTYDYFIEEGQINDIDFQACKSSSDTVRNIYADIDDPLVNKLKIFPTPADDWIYIDGISSVFDSELFNVTGQLEKQFKGIVEKIPVNDLQDGIYLLKITTISQVITRKIIVHHMHSH